MYSATLYKNSFISDFKGKAELLNLILFSINSVP